MKHAERARRSVLFAGVIAVLAACGGDAGRELTIGKYPLTITTDPNPEVGYDAEVTARARAADDALAACGLSFRQFMPEHEMSSDHTWHTLEHLDNGLFRGRSGEFSMGGDWQLEFKLDCGGDVQLASLAYHLEWPE